MAAGVWIGRKDPLILLIAFLTGKRQGSLPNVVKRCGYDKINYFPTWEVLYCCVVFCFNLGTHLVVLRDTPSELFRSCYGQSLGGCAENKTQDLVHAKQTHQFFQLFPWLVFFICVELSPTLTSAQMLLLVICSGVVLTMFGDWTRFCNAEQVP